LAGFQTAAPTYRQALTPNFSNTAQTTGDSCAARIFDLDGTLLDSVDLHAIAWHEALVEFGHDVSFEKARSQIGKGWDKLIPFFLSETEQADHGEALEDWREKRFKEKYLPLVLQRCPIC
jgi:phosphoglycolate phosphatase-like HAD superfamily hydrolase